MQERMTVAMAATIEIVANVMDMMHQNSGSGRLPMTSSLGW